MKYTSRLCKDFKKGGFIMLNKIKREEIKKTVI
jgi:hypothetical protein